MPKVNLNDLKGQLSSRGRAPYENPELEAEIMSLDPAIDGDATIYEASQGDPTSAGVPKRNAFVFVHPQNIINLSLNFITYF
jgi:hypothetical protein